MIIDPTTEADWPALSKLYPAAFPDEPLLPLVRELMSLDPAPVSLAARKGNVLAGHIVLTAGTIAGADHPIALLGPLAVTPPLQRQGIGTALIAAGRTAMAERSVATLLVLGDPAYYGRSGFRQEARITPPYVLPAEWDPAWQSVNADTAPPGRLTLPEPWLNPSYWAPP